ncbi:MAG TPA: hypothetical protein VNU25_02370 [Candidatus Paceibacterota bacterium]|nr:hypothetical protein [Candidatus Paceibacterota bacterium]
MTRSHFLAALLLGLFVFPGTVSAATYINARTVVVADAPEGNAYLAGTDVSVAAALPEDVAAVGGTITLAAPTGGDALLAGGTVSVERPVAGDARIAGAHVVVSAPVAGDLAIAGGTVIASSTARDLRVIGGTVHVTGSGGKAVVYGANVYLAGAFAGDVEVVATDHIALAEGTTIAGALKYDAPQQAAIPQTAVIEDGVTYTGASNFLPTVEQAKTFAIAGASVFFVVRILAVLIAAAVLAGLFPEFSQRVADRALAPSPGRFALLALLGFAVVFAAPVLIFLLLISFVGMAAAFLLLAGYILLLMLSYLYAGIIAGAALGRNLFKRPFVTWKLALLGMLVLSLVGVVPVLGKLVVFILFLAATGAIVSIAFRFAFSRYTHDAEALPEAV